MPETQSDKLLTYEVIREGDHIIVKCFGRLVAGQGDEFYAAVKEVLPDTTHLVLDLTGLTYLDSAGLGTLARLYVTARSSGTEMRLINLGKQVRQVLKLTHLLSVFGSVEEHGITIA